MSDLEERDDHREYVGMGYEGARVLAESRGLRPRRVRMGDTITAEYEFGRLTLWVDDDDAVVDANEG